MLVSINRAALRDGDCTVAVDMHAVIRWGTVVVLPDSSVTVVVSLLLVTVTSSLTMGSPGMSSVEPSAAMVTTFICDA